MDQQEAFLRAIAAAPDDDVTRLVYADWLEEHGELRKAEFLRLECEWRTLPTPANLRCDWGEKLPPADERYAPILRQLTEVSQTVSLG